jgi:uncharacterized phosphosugar-binding protein
MTYQRHVVGTLIALLAWGTSQLAMTALAVDRPTALDDYAQRLPALRKQIPAIVESAEAAAERVAAEPQTHLVFPLHNKWFCYEFSGRAGGLANSWLRVAPRQTAVDNDIVLMGVRHWDTEAEATRSKLTDYSKQGCLTIVFGPSVGVPPNMPYDVLLDDAAPSTNITPGAVNAIANVTLGWMWCCEYAAALTRKGFVPGILRSKGLTDAPPHNEPLQQTEGKTWLGQAREPIEAGTLATLYLARIESLIRDVRSPPVQDAVAKAAEIVATRLREGKRVFLSGTGHAANYELTHPDYHERYTTFYGSQITHVKEGFRRGDLLVWFGYMGCVGLKDAKTGTDCLADLRDKGVDVVFCEAPVPAATNTAPDVLALVDRTVLRALPTPSPVVAIVDQSWSMPDAEVPIPWFPNRMAPVSGVNALLLLRMLDEAVAARLATH